MEYPVFISRLRESGYLIQGIPEVVKERPNGKPLWNSVSVFLIYQKYNEMLMYMSSEEAFSSIKGTLAVI